MAKPLVSIVIPTYNRSSIISRTLDSLQVQTYQNWECIVVDDGSTDNTASIVSEYKKKDFRFSYFNRPSNKPKGASACRNYGLQCAKGSYVIFLDSDDILIDNCVGSRILKIEENPDNDFWIFPMFVQNGSNDKQAAKIPINDNYLIEFLSCKIHWGIMCTMWDINFIKKINGFNELYPRLNDPEVHIRAMIQSKGHFSVFTDIDPDSVYMIASNPDKNNIAKNYAKSLDLFIPDIAKKMNENGLDNELKYLKNYLSDYFLNFYFHSSRTSNLKVLKIFRKNNVISSSVYFRIIIHYHLVLLLTKLLKKSTKKMEKLVKL